MQAIQLVGGTVKFPIGKVFDRQYGQRVEGVDPSGTESLRAIATTLFISAQRKFNL